MYVVCMFSIINRCAAVSQHAIPSAAAVHICIIITIILYVFFF